ncbi:MAG TPA: aldose epimerase family protein [Methylomirabilota bacterium]|nr:aldose epimerase family protein [Methylomirabilota bacterium]
MRIGICVLLLMGLIIGDGRAAAQSPTPGVKTSVFGKTKDGREAHLYTLSNKSGMQVVISDFGGTVVSIKVPDRHGKIGDVVLGYDTLAGYQEGTASFGATVGRYANRIGGAKFSLDGKEYALEKNNGENHLHGGFNKVLWDAQPATGKAGPSLKIHYLSKDGEENFPGNLSVTAVFTLTDANELKIDYTATTDKKTVLNLTNHSYFNLKESGTILDHQLTLKASRFTPVDAGMIPTGELRPVVGTPFDFRQPTAIGARIGQDDEQLKLGHGYDHNWVLDTDMKAEPSLAAIVYEPTTGRVVEAWTTEPGIQVYTGNFLGGTPPGKGGKIYEPRFAVCLETQHFPDSPNHPDFPTTTLVPGKEFHSTTIYKFSVK